MAFKEVDNRRKKAPFVPFNRPSLPYATQSAKHDLEKAGYDIVVKSAWHLHVRKKNSELLVNVWPTAGKYMVDRDSGASYYDGLVEDIDALFNPTIEIPPPPTPEQEMIASYRQNPLHFIKIHYLNKKI